MVKNVVAPATNSVRTLVPCSVRPKVRSRTPSGRSVVSVIVVPLQLPALLQHSDARAATHQALAEFNSEFDIRSRRKAPEHCIMDLDAVLLARLQFAFTIIFHIIFPTFTIGLSAYIATLG